MSKEPEPLPVHIISPDPVPVVMQQPDKPTPIPSSEKTTLPPTTTAQEDLTSLGQRHINRVWEYTQAAIAILVVITFAGVLIHKTMSGNEKPMPVELTAVLFLVIGTYFQRTNHTLIGGVGKKPEGYGGR